MKSVAVAASLLFATNLMLAQLPPAAPAPKEPAAKAPAAKAAPGKAAPAKATPAKKEEKLPDIPGVVIVRPNGTKLSLQVVDSKFHLTFYDKKHKKMAVDVTRATARWPNNRTNTPSEFRTVLNGSGTTLVGERPVLAPLVFNVYLTLLQGDGNEAKAVETYTVPFRG